MSASTPSLKDFVAVLVRPRETMRRILDSGGKRWTVELVVLASICTSLPDPEIRKLPVTMPGLSLTSMLTFILVGMIAKAALYVAFFFVFAWLVTFVGNWLDGRATAADVRAALAWSLVPAVWSTFYRIPIAIYSTSLLGSSGNQRKMIFDFIANGGCTLTVLLLAFDIALDVWVVFLASSCVAEAFQFSSWKGFSTLAAAAAVPIVIAAAAVISLHG
ncbi:MAG TPA: YIP1 family protein [Thermoanaerobaculia bacterium]